MLLIINMQIKESAQILQEQTFSHCLHLQIQTVSACQGGPVLWFPSVHRDTLSTRRMAKWWNGKFSHFLILKSIFPFSDFARCCQNDKCRCLLEISPYSLSRACRRNLFRNWSFSPSLWPDNYERLSCESPLKWHNSIRVSPQPLSVLSLLWRNQSWAGWTKPSVVILCKPMTSNSFQALSSILLK